MAHLIDKDALVAEIERLKERFIAFHHRDGNDWPLDNYGKMRAYNEVHSFLDTLEVKEVDLQEEINNEWEKCNPIDEGMGVESAFIHIEAFDMIARHFFELGLKAKQG